VRLAIHMRADSRCGFPEARFSDFSEGRRADASDAWFQKVVI
jgi:hypothetical protein